MATDLLSCIVDLVEDSDRLQYALRGLKVLEFGQGVAAPFCGMMLADSGADVIKIEPPGKGDISREWAPPYVGEESAYFLSVNRGKKSIVIDLKADEGREIALRLCSGVDVIVENFRPHALERLGLGYHELAENNKKLVYCSITGYGQDGPSADDPAFDLVIQARSGLMDVTGEQGGEPVKMGVPITDIGAGMYASFAIALALIRRDKTGRGERIDVSLLDTAVSWLTYWITGNKDLHDVPRKTGSAHVTIAPYQLFKTIDGYIAIGASTDKLWRNMCQALGLDELLKDPRFKTNPDRVIHREELVGLLNLTISKKTESELLTKLTAAGVPCGPLQTVEEVIEDVQVKHRHMVNEIFHPKVGRILVPGSPIKYTEQRFDLVSSPPPTFGQQSREILREIGYGNKDVEQYIRKGIVFASAEYPIKMDN